MDMDEMFNQWSLWIVCPQSCTFCSNLSYLHTCVDLDPYSNSNLYPNPQQYLYKPVAGLPIKARLLLHASYSDYATLTQGSDLKISNQLYFTKLK